MKKWRPSPFVSILGGAFLGATLLFVVLPTLVITRPSEGLTELPPFPVSVDPVAKTIAEVPAQAPLSFSASAFATALVVAEDAVNWVGAAILATPTYQDLLGDAGPALAVVQPGSRREQVAQTFAAALKWDKGQTQAFLLQTEDEPELAAEGRLHPGTYVVEQGTTPYEVQNILHDRFTERILARYATSTQELIPVEQALTIASMIQRETNDKEEMRIISGIIWNRIFAGMKLQLDATLQYARGTSKNGWWPVVRARDKYIDSPYNTYQNVGLPPAPIASPSVAAVMAALNPVKTDCMFYFHDKKGEFVCTQTYEQHVAALKKAYGRGK